MVGLLILFAGCRAIFGFESATVVDATALPDIPPDASECTDLSVTCADESTLRTCATVGELPADTTCNWGCIDAPTPHCGALDPTGAVVTTQDPAADAALLDQDIAGAITISTTNGSMGVVRPPGTGVINGISFEVRAGIGIFRFKSVAFHGAVTLTGTAPVAFVADGAIVVDNLIDVRGTCATTSAGPGGSQGGNPSGNGQGLGGGGRGENAGATDASGGGGAGFGALGSDGGNGNAALGGTRGNSFGVLEITTLVGGSGGGGGGRAGAGGAGGGGGGAVFLASNTSIQIQPGAGINAGGCGGRGAQNQDGGGGGGGSGGAILLEAPAVILDGALGVNGGGGGAGGDQANGENAPLAGAANGGVSLDGNGGNGGNGGAGLTFSGTVGENNSPSGGGGGAVGRIRINTRTSIVGGVGSTSPPLDAVGTSTTRGTAVVQ